MYIDSQLQFSDAQAVTASAASTNLIDFVKVQNMGVGRPVYLVLLVTEAFTDAGSDSTITPKFETDDNAAFSSPTTLRTLDVFAALTAAGTMRFYNLEPLTASGSFERYLRLYYTVTNGNLTTGKITAFLTLDIEAWKAYATGITVN